MGIIDKVGALLPWRNDRPEEPSARAEGLLPRDDFDRWMDRLFDAPPRLHSAGDRGVMPSADVRETDDGVTVTVEIPGLNPDDVSLAITSGGLTIRGEKRDEREDRRADVYVAERRYGSFVRTIPLPGGLDLDQAEARVADGVLTVKFPKASARPGTHRIPITT